MYWPILLVVGSNVFYHVTAKSIPEKINPLASLMITYLVACIGATILYFLTTKEPSLAREYSSLNWTSFVLGLAIVGLETGYIYMYKLGWNINTGYLVQSILLSIVLIFVGYLLYKESISLNKFIGIGLCIAGLIFINKN